MIVSIVHTRNYRIHGVTSIQQEPAQPRKVTPLHIDRLRYTLNPHPWISSQSTVCSVLGRRDLMDGWFNPR